MVEIRRLATGGVELAARLDAMLDEAADALGVPFNPVEVVLEAREPDGTLLGGLSGYGQLGWLFVKLLALTPEARGRGVGMQLIRRAEDVAREHGWSGVYLDTFTFQAPAFYRKLGYREIGRLPAIDGHPQRIWFARKLAATGETKHAAKEIDQDE
ncbi:GNAT family N-acetyltransferase [Pseudohoeflea coraliihabitans]|uniref:GNAT family N-acetyltransferase n=1 Tax=Pseudohoeflea coraliihabitans TaxID=2860393 RepID=A0ABS6WIH6_9HYPH|nr:GNAT family N-acetyltransferase [Pseudohoeflea sp. DP4N28-3]MBW3095754.1 GNAT family N-acetyltransferase [Pseudohoeflea sp. DP4N28-3]